MTTFITGNTGLSTGPHLDLQVYNPATGSYEDPGSFTSFLTVGENNNPFNYEVTSGRGMRFHPKTGKYKMHEGIDYAVPEGTSLNVNGQHMSTWEDANGGIMSQYLVQTEDGARELLLLHGSGSNKITGTGAVTDYDASSFTPPETPQKPTDSQAEAKERAQNYKEMSKAQLNAAYDKMRSSDANKAAVEGMKMHKAYFGK